MIMRHRRGRNKLKKAEPSVASKKFKPRRRFAERPLNNQVLRIHLLREDLDTLKKKTKSSIVEKSLVRSKRIIIKRNLSFPQPSKEVKPYTSNKVNKTADKFKKPVFKSTIVDKPIGKASEVQKPRKPIRITLISKEEVKAVGTDKICETMNGSAFSPETTKFFKMYYIKFPVPTKHPDGQLQFKFTQLVNDVKTMQLPTPSWKIKVIIKTQKISAVVFTNKAEIERSVTFTADRDTYDIVFDNRPAILLGSPNKVASSKEIEVLLKVLEQLGKDSPMVLYK